MDPANAVRMVLPFFVRRLLKLKASDVAKFILDLPMFLCCGGSIFSESISKGLESPTILPSRRFTIRVAYLSASSELCVTITTSLSFATSFKRSMTCTLVPVSRAPVGSSARRMSGSLTRALAIATLCICPPESWLGFLCPCSPRPTLSNASCALRLRSALETPEMVSASSTLDRIV